MRNSIFLKGVIKLRVLLLFIGTILVTILIIGSMMGFSITLFPMDVNNFLGGKYCYFIGNCYDKTLL